MSHQRGTGTVYLRGKIWWISYYIHGAQVRESTGYTEKADAESLLKQRIGEVASGSRTSARKATIDDLCRLVIEDYKLRKKRDAKHTEWRYKANVEPLLGRLPAARFGSPQIKQYIARRRADGASDSTVNRELAIVRRGFKLGAAEDPPLVHRQPTFPKLEEDNARQGFLEQSQYEDLLEKLPENLKALFVCGYHTGARKNELRLTRWDEVDFGEMAIRIPASRTKNKKPRVLPIYGDMERWLRHQLETLPANNRFVFHGAHGRPVDNHLLGWTDACVAAELPGLLFHDMRRSAVRNMKRAGVQDRVAMDISGHKTRSVFDRYNIVDETDMHEAGDKLEEYAEKKKQERAAKLKLVKKG